MEKKNKVKKDLNSSKSEVKKEAKEQTPKWFVINARGKIIGRLASKIATILMGKNKVSYLPYKESGDKVIVINAGKIVATGRKNEQKKYYRYSGYPGGLKVRSLKTLRHEDPERIIKHAVEGMLPKTRLGRSIFKNLYVYSGEKHPHEGQKAEPIEI